MSETTGGAPAGWYEDGQNAGQERYWDGTAWTDEFRPLAPAAPPPPAAPSPATPYAEYAPAQPGAVGQKRGLSGGAIAGIVIAVVVVIVAAIVLILGFAVWGWGGSGGEQGSGSDSGAGASPSTEQAFIEAARHTAESIGLDISSFSDADILVAGNKICEVGRAIDPENPLSSVGALLDLSTSIEPTLFSVAGAALSKLCPEVISNFESIGQSFGE